MGIELKPCSKCGGKGELENFDKRYNPKYKSLKYLSDEGLKTWAQCKNCGKYTKASTIPIDVINEWNNGEIYSDKEWFDKLDKEYVGKVYLDDEIEEYILQTDFEKNSIEFTMTNTAFSNIYFDKLYNCYAVLFNVELREENINKFVSNFLKYIKNNNFRVAKMKRMLPIGRK